MRRDRICYEILEVFKVRVRPRLLESGRPNPIVPAHARNSAEEAEKKPDTGADRESLVGRVVHLGVGRPIYVNVS